MPKYGVMIHGQNFLVELDGRTEKRGFYTWRYVEAGDPDSAVQMATQSLREEKPLRDMVRNGEEDRPFMDVDDLREFDISEELPAPTGFLWYPMRPKRWWQFWRR